MKKLSLFMAASMLASPALALNVTLGGIANNAAIPEKHAFCVPDGNGKTKDGSNINPAISWSDAPVGTKSFAIVMVDPDVPAKFDDANQEGKTIAADFPRQHFYHWVVVDIPSSITSIAEGEDSRRHEAAGKPVGRTIYGTTGQNDYATFMKGTFGGYDGPCPPWNDLALHHYHFQVYALDVEKTGLKDAFTGKQAMDVIKSHTLATAEVVATFTNNSAVK